VNGMKVIDMNELVKKENAIGKQYSVIRKGKKKYVLVKHL
jgi:tyrosyl-tRNA synthetase